MEAKKEERQSRFFEWLARSVSSAQLSELYQAFTDLEAALSSNRYLHHLTQPLVETEDADAIDRLYGELSTNKQFMRSYRSGVKLSLLRHYARYCRERQPAATVARRQEAAPSGDALIDRLKKDGISYADNRPKNGALWISQSPKTDALIKEAKAQGVQFVFSEAKQQWWTRDVSPKSIGKPEAIRPETVKRNQNAFFEWLRAQGFDTVDIYTIYGIARKIHAMLLEEGVTSGLFGTCEIDRLQACINVAKQKVAFTKGDKKEDRLWTKAVNCYLQFAESEKFAVTPTQVKQATPEPVFTPSAAEEVADPVQPSDEKLAAGLVQENGFRQWLRQSESDEQADQIVDVIRSAEQFAQRNHMKGIKMLGVVTSTMRLSVRRMSASNAFIKNDLRLYQRFKRAAALLVKYGTLLDSQDSHSDVKPAPVSATSAAPVSGQTEVRSKEDLGLDPSLQALLQGEQLSALRSALMQKGIRTLEDFKRLNLWVFMNQNGLYSIGERQAVCSLVRRAMASKAAAETDVRWKIITQKSEYTGPSPADALAEYCRAMAGKYPLRFRSLIGQRMTRSETVPLSRTRHDAGDIRMDNPEAYISCETDESCALTFACWIGEMCRDDDVPQKVISNAPAKAVVPADGAKGDLPEQIKTVDAEPVQVPVAPPVRPSAVAKPSVISPLQRKVEQLVQDADLSGMTLEQLYSQIPGATMVALKQVRDNSASLVEIEDRLIHKDAFVDWDEAAQRLEEIVGKLLLRNNGYASAAQLYEYVRAEMQMFLNDNDMDDPRKVFDLAQHLFEKEGYHGKQYTFWMKAHISRSKETLTSNLDVFKKFARDHNGFFQFDDLVAYLERVGIRTGNLRGQMQLGIKPIFFYYSDEEIISAESMRMDEDWLAQAGKAFQRLFADVGDHVVLRSINPIWYEQLPTLPGYLPWTPLLLQYILQFYGEKLGAKTIGAELNQKYCTLHAMLVTPDSEVQTFADAVVAYLIDSGIPERQFEAEELRRRLVDGGLIAGNELIWNMPRAIGSDPRFAWDASGEKVNIKV